MYLLDTNACIGVLTGRKPSVVARMQKRNPREIFLCTVVKAELYYGARKSAKTSENLALLHDFFAPLQCLPFDDLAAEHYGFIRADLAREGALIGPNDLLIAAIARSRDLCLVTHNSAEFSRVLGLRIEDWE